MNNISIVLDTLPSHFGLHAGDWTGLLLSRLIASPLVEKFNGEYQLGILSEVRKIEPFKWRLILKSSEYYTAHDLLNSWRKSATLGHSHAMKFIRQVHVINGSTIDIVCRHEYTTIIPFLDSPWLWAAMDAATALKLRKSNYANELTFETNTRSKSTKLSNKKVILLLNTDRMFPKTEKWLSAGLPIPLFNNDTVKPIDIFYTLSPNKNTTHRGPFLRKQALNHILEVISKLKLLDTSWNKPTYNLPIVNNASTNEVITQLSYTNFFPNELLANLIRMITAEHYKHEVTINLSSYCDVTPEYSHGQTAADILPVVPYNSSPTSIVWELLSLTKNLLMDTEKDMIKSALVSLEERIDDSFCLIKTKELIELITSITGFGIMGKYRGYYNFNNIPEIPISDFGFVDLKGLI